MKEKIQIAVIALVATIAVASMPAIGQEDAYTCIDRHPNGVEVWGCFEGEPYWSIAQFAGDRPMVSGGTLYMPSQAKRPMGMGGRIVDNAVTSAKWQFEAKVNRKVQEKLYKIF